MTPTGYLVHGEFIPADVFARHTPFAAPRDAVIPLYTHGEHDVVIPAALVKRMDLADRPLLEMWYGRSWRVVYFSDRDRAHGTGRTIQGALDAAAETLGGGA